METYTDDYRAYIREGTRSSAGVVVPLVLRWVRPLKSVIDVGCGTGEWLAVFEEYGVEDAWGVDGDYVNREALAFTEKRFVPHDLTQPLSIDRDFDLVVSLEVAEHLPAESAQTFVCSLTSLGTVVLFSAAVPEQGGNHHINERWQDYWAKLFAQEGYAPVDCIRNVIWNDQRVCWWYAQNVILYVERKHLEKEPALKREYELRGTSQLSIVHPRGEWVPGGWVEVRLRAQRHRLYKIGGVIFLGLSALSYVLATKDLKRG